MVKTTTRRQFRLASKPEGRTRCSIVTIIALFLLVLWVMFIGYYWNAGLIAFRSKGKLHMIYVCNIQVLSHVLLIYICKLHWNLNSSVTTGMLASSRFALKTIPRSPQMSGELLMIYI